MPVQTLVPCLWFDDQAESAAEFYTRTFPGGRINAKAHYPESSDNPSGKLRGSVMTVEFEISGQSFTALNGGPLFTINPSISFFVYVESAQEADRLYAALAEGGMALMPIDAYPWSERYAWVQDRFGVSWQIMTEQRSDGGATIAPCLMFAGAVHGKAAEAIRSYVKIFPDSGVDRLETYSPGEGPSGTIKHGRFTLAHHDLVAMDSHVEHAFGFNEAVSLQVMCRDQAEIDRYWAALGEGGEPGPCGWLKDRFGISWQVVPTKLSEWLKSNDATVRDRAFKAMLAMHKPDLAALNAALRGTT